MILMRIGIFITILVFSLSSYADENIVARVNGVALTAMDLEEAINQLIPRGSYHGGVSDKKRAEFRERALENIIVFELQHQDAVARGMKPDKKQVKSQLEKIKDRFKSKKDYKKWLEYKSITEDYLKTRIEKSLLVEAVTAKTVNEPAQASDAALKDYYDKNPSKFKQPESARVRIISTKDEQKANEILKRIKAGEDFGSLAAQMSEDNFRIKGGDLGYIHRGRLLPEIESEAFKMKPGAVSGLIKAEGLWFLIKVEDARPERQMSFEESKSKLKNELEGQKAAELKDKWISDLKAKAKIEILAEPQNLNVK